MFEVIMPKLGLTMETGVIEKWLKKEGDKVETGDVLFEVMTDKVSLEVEAYNSGILRKIVRSEGEEVPVTEVVAYIGEPGEDIPVIKAGKTPEVAEIKAEDTGAKITETQKEIPQKESPVEERETIKISPLAKNFARVKGVDINKVKGSGPGGRIVKEDIENYISATGASVVQPVGQQAEVSAAGEIKVTPEALTATGPEERIKISPLARSLAKELGIDYKSETISGTGPDGRIVKEDILAFAELKKSLAAQAMSKQAVQSSMKAQAAPDSIPMMPPAVKSERPLKGMRKVIAERLTYSKQNIPHIIFSVVVDVTSLIALREKIKDKVLSTYGAKLTYTDFIIKAVAIVLAEQPVINASLKDGNHIIYEDINVGLAVSVEEGLIVPTVYGADRLSLFDIAKKRIELVGKAKESKLTLEEISNATFTVSNLGMFGIRSFTAIINPPQGAILSIGEIYKAPVVVEDKIEIRSLMEISVAVDHRIIDGADAARYDARLKEILENPELLLI